MTVKRPDRSLRAVIAAVQRLESLESAGVQLLAKPGRGGIDLPTQPRVQAVDTPIDARQSAGTSAAIIPPAESTSHDSLAIIRKEVGECQLCDELASTRTQTVFGVGNPHARLCFLGEAPGADEDRQGEPFVGRAGQLLTKIIEACTLTRNDVYILNVLKCRPPGNRNPLPSEVANCRGFLDRQLSLIRPEFICCLGAVAAQTLLDTQTPISRMRGKYFDYQGIRVMCTYHPAYLLRNPAAKKDVWEDMKMLMRDMGIDLDEPAARG